MSKKPPSEYDKARAIWYKKLEDEGFEDIEVDENNLKSWSGRFTTERSLELKQSKEAYYQMATNFLNEYKFENAIEKLIWEYHAEAISVRDIVKLLHKKTKVMSIYRRSVWEIIHRLENSMKKMYLSNYESRND